MAKIIDFGKALTERKNERSAQLDELDQQVEAMDMDAAIRYLLGMEGGSKEAAQQCCDTMENIHAANLKVGN